MFNSNLKSNNESGKSGKAGKWTGNGFQQAKNTAKKVTLCWHCNQPKGFLHICKKTSK